MKAYPFGPRQALAVGEAAVREAGSKIGMACGLEFRTDLWKRGRNEAPLGGRISARR